MGKLILTIPDDLTLSVALGEPETKVEAPKDPVAATRCAFCSHDLTSEVHFASPLRADVAICGDCVTQCRMLAKDGSEGVLDDEWRQWNTDRDPLEEPETKSDNELGFQALVIAQGNEAPGGPYGVTENELRKHRERAERHDPSSYQMGDEPRGVAWGLM